MATPSDDQVYEIVANRRIQWDALVWQVPVVVLTGQAFLFTIALAGDTSRVARCIASVLALLMSFLAMQLMARHRQAEITDAHWLSEYEARYHKDHVVHGAPWREIRNSTNMPRVFNVSAYRVWMAGFSIFGAAALLIGALAIGWPDALSGLG